MYYGTPECSLMPILAQNSRKIRQYPKQLWQNISKTHKICLILRKTNENIPQSQNTKTHG